jgi:hypothetical protein
MRFAGLEHEAVAISTETANQTCLRISIRNARTVPRTKCRNLGARRDVNATAMSRARAVKRSAATGRRTRLQHAVAPAPFDRRARKMHLVAEWVSFESGSASRFSPWRPAAA